MEHIESTTVNGRAIVKIFFHPNAKVEMAVAQVTAVAAGVHAPDAARHRAAVHRGLQRVERAHPSARAFRKGSFRASNCSIFATSNIRTALATVQGAAIPYPYGGKQRQGDGRYRAGAASGKGLSPADVVNAVGNQNLILPSGTSKIGQFEYDVELNSSPPACRN